MHEPRTLDHLLAQVSRLHGSRGNQVFNTLPLHHGQYPLLGILTESDGLTHTDLASRLCVSAPTVSKTVQRLEGRGFVIRKADPDDERKSRVYMTEAGVEVLRETRTVLDGMNHELESALTEQERGDLFRLLLKLRDHFIVQQQSKA